MPEFVNNSQVRPEFAVGISPQAAPVPLVNTGGTPKPPDQIVTYDDRGRLLFGGRPTPFRRDKHHVISGPGGVDEDGETGDGFVYADADKKLIKRSLYEQWAAAGAPDAQKRPQAPAPGSGDSIPGANIGGAGGTGASLIDDPTIKHAWEQYVKGIDGGSMLKSLLGLDPTQPLPSSISTTLAAPQVGSLDAPATIQGRDVDMITAPTVGPASVAEGTTVSGADIAGLQEIAAGRGPLADQVRAQNELAVTRATQAANSLANQARGSERRGARRGAMIRGQELAFEGQARATEVLAAKATEATAKIADLDNQKKQLQAQLDAARRNNDADRAQRITEKIAEIDLEVRKANADIAAANANRDIDVQDKNIGNTIDVGKANADIAAGNADRTLSAGEKTADLSLKAQDQEERQRVERARLRIEVQKAIEESARGILNEAQRQSALAIARQELALAQQRLQLARDEAARAQANADRAFWTTAITTLLASVVPTPKPPGAKHGGAVTGRRIVEVGEAGDHELIIPIKGKLAADLAAALEIEAKPFKAAGTSGTIETPEDLAEAVAASMRTFRPKAAPPPVEEDDMLSAMSGGIIRARKRRDARSY